MQKLTPIGQPFLFTTGFWYLVHVSFMKGLLEVAPFMMMVQRTVRQGEIPHASMYEPYNIP